jgi:hypothetical protein
MFAYRFERAHRILIRELRHTPAVCFLGTDCDVIQAEDALQPAVRIDHGQPPHLRVPHRLECGVDVLIRRAGVDGAGDHVAHGDLPGRPPFGRGGHGDVAVGNHAHDVPLIIDHW